MVVHAMASRIRLARSARSSDDAAHGIVAVRSHATARFAAMKEIAEKIRNLTVVAAPKDMQDLLRLGVRSES